MSRALPIRKYDGHDDWVPLDSLPDSQAGNETKGGNLQADHARSAP
jgi:hypothetical protein